MFHTYIDNCGILKERYRDAKQLEGYAFVMCACGEFRINIYMSEYVVKKNSVITLLPNSYFRVVDQSPDAELYVARFKQSTITSADLHSTIMEHITHIIEFPVVEFSQKTIDLMCDYIKLLMRVEEIPEMGTNHDFISSTLKQFILLIGTKRQMAQARAVKNDSAKALVMKVTKLIVMQYTKERSPAIYAKQMQITPQHLSTTVKKVLGLTITDLIAQFVIIDAETKLTSTNLSIKEIAATLNFEDISTFGKYFKRYTQLSPRQYRSEKMLPSIKLSV